MGFSIRQSVGLSVHPPPPSMVHLAPAYLESQTPEPRGRGEGDSAAPAPSAARGPACVGVDGSGAGCAGRAERAAAALDLDAGPGAEVEALAGTAVGRTRVGGDCAARAIVPESTIAAGLLGAAVPSADKITAVFLFSFLFFVCQKVAG